MGIVLKTKLDQPVQPVELRTEPKIGKISQNQLRIGKNQEPNPFLVL